MQGESKRNKKELNPEVRENKSVNSSINSVTQGGKMQRTQSMKTCTHNQITAEDFEKKCCWFWEKYVYTAKEDNWVKCETCRN